MPRTPELAASYLATTYRIAGDPAPIEIRVDRLHPEVDRLLAQYGASDWAFVTACNPGSQRLTPDENGARHARLRERVAALGLAVHDGEGVPDAPDWPPERSLWIAGLEREAARLLGQEFGQYAVVTGQAGAAAELVWIEG